MNHRKNRGVGVLILAAAIGLPTSGCGDDDDDDEGQPGGSHLGGASTGGVAGQSGGMAGSAAGGESQPGGTAAIGGLTSDGGGQGGTPEPDGAGRAGAAAGDGGTAAGGSAAGEGGDAPGGAAGSGQAGERGTGRVDCGGQSCDRCCFNLDGAAPEFECAPIDKAPLFCGIDQRFDMTCDAKSDCGEGRVCCMERTKVSLLASAHCSQQCPVATSTTLHYELCADDEDCTSPQQCVSLPNLYFRVCQ